MRLALILGLLSIFVFGYQNCGSSFTNDPGFFVQSDSNVSSSFDTNGCYGQNCTADPYMLWAKIRESNPYYVPPTGTHFTVAGSCGVGNFKKHSVTYTLQESFGGQRVIGKTTSTEGNARCIVGLFSLPIKANQNIAIMTGGRYELTIEIIGLSDSFQPVANPSGTSVSRIDVIYDTVNVPATVNSLGEPINPAASSNAN